MEPNVVIGKEARQGEPNQEANRPTFSWTDGLACFLPIATWLTISWLICCGFNPHGAAWGVAVPAALGIGFVLTFLGAQIIGSGVSTLAEFNVSCGILLILVLVLVPLFRAAREAAHKRVASRQTATKQVSQKVSRPQAIP